MAKDRRLSVRIIAEETGLDKSAVHRILTDRLHMRKICAKLVPKIIPTTPICFSLSRPSLGSFVLPYFEVANVNKAKQNSLKMVLTD